MANRKICTRGEEDIISRFGRGVPGSSPGGCTRVKHKITIPKIVILCFSTCPATDGNGDKSVISQISVV